MNNPPINREIKTAASATSAQSTSVSRDHPAASGASTKTKAKAVVTPFSRSQGGQKKVNINTVVSQFYIKSQDEVADEPQVRPQFQLLYNLLRNLLSCTCFTHPIPLGNSTYYQFTYYTWYNFKFTSAIPLGKVL